MMTKWGAIFDWDGVIIDSSELHKQSWLQLAQLEGFSLDDDAFVRSFGMKNEDIIPNILGWASDPKEIVRIADKKEVIYRNLVRQRGIDPLPGVREWLKLLHNALIPCAIGSSTERRNIDCVLDITGLSPFFDEIVCADDVMRGKPDPQVFQLVADRIEIPPSRCVVFEDAHVGIKAARSGGMKVVGVATTHPITELEGADLKIHSLSELTIESIKTLING